MNHATSAQLLWPENNNNAVRKRAGNSIVQSFVALEGITLRMFPLADSKNLVNFDPFWSHLAQILYKFTPKVVHFCGCEFPTSFGRPENYPLCERFGGKTFHHSQLS